MERLSIEAAAQRLRVSVSTVRRRIKAGELVTEREETPQGFRYVVILGEGLGPAPPAAESTTVQLEAVIVERDWLRTRVEELTALLNREQEAVLRLAAGERLLIQPPADTQPPMQTDRQGEQVPETAASAPRRPWWRFWR